ncbi:class I SAM-dependent methyltransferase [Roseibium polysiphoniae]|uniref:Class I SAM-dependent methyltransferase n=1 Tax=Roseibium polysiphoniae TaxID=2571221 RepID=A0ABR9C852_9HYPH|nr:class I SAM-dependent methyltransferase [Roseibium polysiphoniae]MBD8876087.1 class I SAM-dependent methyltransferase [Roseibium polysiphoniae]
MTTGDLKTRIKQRIAAQGPITVADYMATCLGDPQAGYYTTRQVFGREGDFTTAPEVSQMFGELIGAFCLQAWERMGSPKSFQLVELGPGRGTLMSDLLRTAALRPAFLEAAELTLVEMSQKLRKQQAKKLEKSGLQPRFAEGLDQIESGPLVVVANEFFDALPIHQFVKTASGWLERLVGLDDAGKLGFGLGTARLADHDLPKPAALAPDGSILETQPAANAIAEEIGARIAKDGGCALFVDYGYLQPAPGDTLQALYKHSYDDVFARPGEADLTAHVNFEALAAAATRAGAIAFPPLEQGEFLLRLGLLERAGALGTGKSHLQQEGIRDAVERLAAPNQMGQLFKVLALSNTPAPLSPFDEPSGR